MKTYIKEINCQGSTFFNILVSLAIVAILGLGVNWLSQKETGLTPVKLATSKNVWSSLPLLADNLGYFKGEGLDVSLIYGAAGRYNMDALVSKDAEFATVVEVNLAYMGFTGNQDFQVISSVVTSNSLAVVGRRSSGIDSPSDLASKSLAYSPATGGELFAYTFLENNNVSTNNISFRKIQPAGLQTAIIAGDVEAVSTWEPFVYNIEKALGEDAVVFRDASAYTGYMNLAIRPSWAVKNEAIITAFLKALKKAEAYAKEHSKEAQAILANIMETDLETVQSIWPYFDIALSLDLTDQISVTSKVANSIKENQKAFSDKTVPDYSPYFSNQYLHQMNK